MSLILCAQTVFGNLFVIRTLQIFATRSLIPTSALTKIGTAIICVASFVVFFCDSSPILAGILILIAHLSVIPMGLYLERKKIAELCVELPTFVNRWIMNLKLGAASTSSREKSLASHSEQFQALMRPLFSTTNAQQLSRKHPLMSLSVSRELVRTANEPHAALARLENLRETLRRADEFRRKSGQATRQTTIQSSVMLFLLFALMIFTLHRYGWRRCSDLVLWSVLLSAFGVASMSVLSRKTRWKV